MRLQLRVFGSRVARRVFASFVLASAVPLIAVTVLVVTQVGNTLEENAFDDLENASRGYGQLVLDKLLSLTALLPNSRALVANSAGNVRLAGFTAAGIAASDGIRPLFGELPPAWNEIAFGASAKPMLVSLPTATGQQILLVQTVDAETVIGVIDPEYLWRASALLSDGMEVCVFAGTIDEPLFCSVPLPDSVLSDLTQLTKNTSSGEFHWSDGDQAWLTAYWELFVSSAFASEPWHVVVSQPRAVALESLSAFNRVVPQAVLLSLAVVLLLSVSQVRRTLKPLQQLVLGTKRIADGDFAGRVAVEGQDEFSALGAALNTMAGKLGRQFGTLTTLAEIDRLILSSEEIDQVLQAALERMRLITPGGDVSVLLLDLEDRHRGRLYSKPARLGERSVLKHVALDENDCGWLVAQPEGRLADAATLNRCGIDLHRASEGPQGFVVPILNRNVLAGVLIVVFDAGSTVDVVDLGSIRELASRLAVAIAAAERDRELFQRAHFDGLTGLPNRQLCHDRLGQALAQARRDDHQLAVLFIDLDGFKNINDSLGHWAGDELLRQTALRFTSVLRDTDTVARLGGDEYVVILPRVHGVLEVESIVTTIMTALEAPFPINGRESFISASIGVTLFPEDGASAEELLRKADTAMYSAKDLGRARCVFFAEEMDRRVHEKLSLHTDLRNAIANDELLVVYQPQVELGSRRVVSAEALLRWKHPTRGPVSPELFIPILEETGLIEVVGKWVIETTLRDFLYWRQCGAPLGRVAVNITARQLFSAGFAESVDECLRAAGLESECLELELTETTLVKDFRASNAVLAALEAKGIRIAVDDFGTGYSSLGYLKDMVFDTLKIDRAFIINLPEDKSLAIVKAIVAVANALGKNVIAEGVETEPQRAQLIKVGCNFAQGFLFSRPIAREDLLKLLRDGQGQSEPRHAAAAGA